MKAWLLTAFAIVLAGGAEAHAARRVRVRDEAGAPVDVEVDALHPAGRVNTRLCRGVCPASLSRLVVDGSHGRAVLRSAPTLDRLTDTVVLDLHRLGDRCPRLAIEPSADYFAPPASSATTPCNAAVVDITLQRRWLEVDVHGLALGEISAQDIVVAQPPLGVAVVPLAYDAAIDRLRLRLELDAQARTLDTAGLVLRPRAHHGVKVVVDLARARQQSAALQVDAPAAVPIVRQVELIRPPSPLDSDTTIYCVRYSAAQPSGFLAMIQESGDEWQNPSCNERRMSCRRSGPGVSCPLLRDDEVNAIVAIDTTGAFGDTPTCTVRDGACAFDDGFDEPVVGAPIHLAVARDVAEVARSGDPVFVIVDKFLPEGERETKTFKLERGGDVFAQDFVRADPGATRYDLRVFGGALDPSTRRNAVAVANRITKVELLQQTHDASAVTFRRTSAGLRAWTGMEFPWFSPKRTDPELRRSWGVAPVVGGAARFEWNFARVPITLFPELGLEGALTQTWTVDAPEARAHAQQRWVTRGYVGGGIRTRALRGQPLSAELVGAWMPEFPPRGAKPSAGDPSVGLLGVRYGFGLLPRFLDRLRASFGVEMLFGSHTRFVLPNRTVIARVHARIVVGLGATIGRLLPSESRPRSRRRRAS
ncbi:MAG: hypothetical protein K1X88_03690 [Nannocystaceae bacterium]|nr:hypothetical protein [Nannocystaceae bacterium]